MHTRSGVLGVSIWWTRHRSYVQGSRYPLRGGMSEVRLGDSLPRSASSRGNKDLSIQRIHHSGFDCAYSLKATKKKAKGNKRAVCHRSNLFCSLPLLNSERWNRVKATPTPLSAVKSNTATHEDEVAGHLRSKTTVWTIPLVAPLLEEMGFEIVSTVQRHVESSDSETSDDGFQEADRRTRKRRLKTVGDSSLVSP